jgi:hypothetical protein
MNVFYNDINSILVINPHGIIRKLYTPIRVYPLVNIVNFTKSKWLYVEEVHLDHQELLLYLISGKQYPYYFFEIKISF